MQLINSSILIVLQKLLKLFNDTAVSTFFVLSATGALPVILALVLNISEFVIKTFDSSL